MLTTIVAPIATQRPVLFVLRDGMSHRGAAELLESLTRAGFTELRRKGRPERALGVSTLPSVTTFSRTSLFAGGPTRGTATNETKGFAAQVGLSQPGAAAPLLFHKKAIADEHSGLARELRDEVAGSRRTVGVVVNAIDDHLARSEQIASRWSVRDVPALRLLLEAARDSGRVVVLASDHGHVIERGSELRSSAGGGGERWRVAGEQEAGEVIVEGPRVLAPSGRCILAWDERVRYGAKKNGYHGGGTAQEVLTPILVLTPDLAGALEGWEEAPLDEPAWWVGERAEAAPILAESADPRPEPEPGEQLSLERSRQASAARKSSEWIEALLASETFASQRAAAGRAPLPDERVALILETLDSHGDRLLRDALGRACGIAPLRLTGQLAALRQLLNVDGYPVLEVDEATGDVFLDRELLSLQFGLGGS
ncbi:MAG: BREX-2 system phosphatase PglZ [Actinobacteria bacterium]|nr:BREX-2 system phosphatase PglZ [Actinomycetota bacterium]